MQLHCLHRQAETHPEENGNQLALQIVTNKESKQINSKKHFLKINIPDIYATDFHHPEI